MNRIVLVQGPSDYVSELKQAWKGYDILWSTWKGEENKYTEDDFVLFNDMPTDRGVQNLALQYTTTFKGVELIKTEYPQYERILKWRSDMIPTNPKDLMNLFVSGDWTNFLYWHMSRGGYFVDYVMEGSVENIYNAWNIPTVQGEFSERVTTDHIRENVNSFVHYFGKDLSPRNDIRWLKKRINISTYNSIDAFTP